MVREVFNFLGSRLVNGLAWPQGGPWPRGARLKWAKGRFGSKNVEKVTVLRMEFSIVENLSGLQESISNLARSPQVHFGEKSKNLSNFIKFIDFSPFPLFGVPWSAVVPRTTWTTSHASHMASEHSPRRSTLGLGRKGRQALSDWSDLLSALFHVAGSHN